MLKILRYRLYMIDPLNPADATLAPGDLLTPSVVLMPADRMRAERESTKLLSPGQRDRKANAETWMLLWLWCAATRMGITSEGFEVFAGQVVDYDEVDANGEVVDPDDRDGEAGADVDPTDAGPLTT